MLHLGLFKRASVLATVAMVLLGSACTSPQQTPPGPDFATFAESYLGYPLNEGEAHGLSAEAVAILERAGDQGVLTQSDLRESVELTVACFDEVGIPYERFETTDHIGLPYSDFTFRAPPGTDEDDQSWLLLADQCQDSNSLFITALYQNQPASIAATNDWFAETRRDEALACLVNQGVPVSEDDNFESFLQEAKLLLDETGDSSCLEIVIG